MLDRCTKLRLRGYLLVVLSWAVLVGVLLHTAAVWDVLGDVMRPVGFAHQRFLAYITR